ncbi:MAG: hypothetical protein BRD55_05970 [Bacteroidetes bacterium SW_9_63_38]|nr:MAG: hypothetical protein BRD55_05970 [Bacteroidetes bacterium SW_9_63_38]
MSRRLCFLLVGRVAVPIVAVPLSATAQLPADSIRADALRGDHGPDLEGRDGPLGKAGRSLLLLYHEYRAFRAHFPDSTFTSTIAELPTRNGRVAIEAVAVDGTRALPADLEAVGLTGGVTGGRVVSGWLPIDQIPTMVSLHSLRGLIESARRR